MNIQVINKSNNPLPTYATKGSAGFDIRVDFSRSPENSIVSFGEQIKVDNSTDVIKVTIPPMTRTLLPTGLFTAIPEGWQVSFRPRSGMAFKKGLTLANTPSTIDADYRGEWFIAVINLSNKDIVIEDGERICQGILEQVHQFNWEQVETLDETERGNGGFNSTGSK